MTLLTPAQLAQVLALKASGNVIHAIKEVRAATGLGLAEAKDLVDGLRADGVAAPASTPVAARASGIQLDAAQQGALCELLERGQAIEAIKQVRTWTGLGLKEAKDFVDAVQGRPPRVASGGNAVRIVLVFAGLLAAAGLVWWVTGR